MKNTKVDNPDNISQGTIVKAKKRMLKSALLRYLKKQENL